MEQHRELLNRITRLLKQLHTATQEELIEKFERFLEEFKKIGPFNSATWHWKDTQIWWIELEKLSQNSGLARLIVVLNKQLQTCTLDEIEPLEFIKIELEGHHIIDPIMMKERLRQIVERYPNNLEFLNTYAHNLTTENNSVEEYLTGIKFYKKYYSGSSPGQNTVALNAAYNAEIRLYNLFNENGDDARAEQIITEMGTSNFYSSSMVLKNALSATRQVYNERKRLIKKMENMKTDYQDSLEKISESSRQKSFEQLVIFTAVITFVITAAGSAIKSPIPLWEITGLGMTLLVFVLAVMMCLDKPQHLLKDFRFYILMAAFGLTAALAITSTMEKVTTINNYHTTETITKKVEQNPKPQQVVTGTTNSKVEQAPKPHQPVTGNN